jgi:hypothetical protein
LHAPAGQAQNVVRALLVGEQMRPSTRASAVLPERIAHADIFSTKPRKEYRAARNMDLALLEGKAHNILI